MPRIKSEKKGSTILTALGMGFVLTLVIIGIHTFSSHRIHTVVGEGKRVKALAAAETGLEMILGELSYNSGFVTHKLKDANTWDAEEKYTAMLKANSEHALTLNSSGSGTYSGKLGDEEFKVRAGNIPYKDNENTKTIDEGKSYLKVEALGKFDKTVRRVEAHINRRFPAREFLMYDGDICSLVFGTCGEKNTNRFSVGHLYGHKGVEIGNVSMCYHNPGSEGTKQELNNMSAIISGAGNVYFYHQTKASFIDKNSGKVTQTTIPKNADFPTSGTYENNDKEKGGFPKELLEKQVSVPENLKEWIKDKSDGISLVPQNPPFDKYKELASSNEGMLITSSNNSDKIIKYAMPDGWLKSGNSLDAVYLDFGNELHEGNIKKDNFPKNGIIYSDKDIVIKGNPPATVSIVSEKNIFIAGDFNQSGGGDSENPYGFPQKYGKGAVADGVYDYDDAQVKLLSEDSKKEASKRYHQSATVVAKERIVYDYRNPMDCFENELFPYIKYKLAAKLCDESKAREFLNSKPELTITVSEETLDSKIEEFASGTCKLKDTEEIKKALKEKYKNSDHKLSFDEFNDITKIVWKSLAKDYDGGDKKNKGGIKHSSKENLGIYKLLEELSGEAAKAHQEKYLYFPEITVDGMFISCGKRNNTFYPGPDEGKFYNEIGNKNNNVGFEYFGQKDFIHRMYGSEVNMRTTDVHEINYRPTNKFYLPPTRRKIYDESLPSIGLEDSKIEIASFIVLSWMDTAATEEDWNNF